MILTPPPCPGCDIVDNCNSSSVSRQWPATSTRSASAAACAGVCWSTAPTPSTRTTRWSWQLEFLNLNGNWNWRTLAAGDVWCGQVYCLEDYCELHAPKCHKCDKTIFTLDEETGIIVRVQVGGLVTADCSCGLGCWGRDVTSGRGRGGGHW